MTEEGWLAATDLRLIPGFLKDPSSDRKLGLFAVAACRCIWDVLADEVGRNAVELAEQFADGQATADELNVAAPRRVGRG